MQVVRLLAGNRMATLLRMPGRCVEQMRKELVRTALSWLPSWLASPPAPLIPVVLVVFVGMALTACCTCPVSSVLLCVLLLSFIVIVECRCLEWCLWD
jgi:hypothetical protein